MFDVTFGIWMASRTRWVHLRKLIKLHAVPRVGEFVKFNNDSVGDYFSWTIREVCYRESGEIFISTELLDDIGGRGYSFEDEDELDEYFSAYIDEGWVTSRGITENTRVKLIDVYVRSRFNHSD